MIIGDEIIKMFGENHGKGAAPGSKVRGSNSLEAGSHLATESFSIRNIIIDKGGRRFEIDRRKFKYAIHLPERRFGEDRRIGVDRRNSAERRNVKRSTADRRESFAA